MSTPKNQLPGEYRSRLLELCKSGQLSIILIVAPPRTNSTLLEHVIGNSPSVQFECHEPFFGMGRAGFEPDTGYKQIYDAIGGKKFEESNSNGCVVVKDIIHWISIGNEFHNLVELTNRPVVIVIRNPLLSVESRLRKIIVGLEKKVDANVLAEFSRQAGFSSWNGLLERKLSSKEYVIFDGLLKDHAPGWATGDETDFAKLFAFTEYLGSQQKPHVILDTTDLRAIPEEVTSDLCNILEIQYSPKMVDWDEPSADFYTTQNPESSRAWYDTLQDSTRINPPIEIPPPVDLFPESMRPSLMQQSLPIYYRLASRKFVNGVKYSFLNTQTFAGVELKMIDPVYAITNDASLVQTEWFRTAKKAYDSEIDLFERSLS